MEKEGVKERNRQREKEGGEEERPAGLILLNWSCSCSVRECFVYPNLSPWTSHLLLGMAMSLHIHRQTHTHTRTHRGRQRWDYEKKGRERERCGRGNKSKEKNQKVRKASASERERPVSERRERGRKTEVIKCRKWIVLRWQNRKTDVKKKKRW